MLEQMRRPAVLGFSAILIILLLVSLFQADYSFAHFRSVEEMTGWEKKSESEGNLQLTHTFERDQIGKTMTFYTSDCFVQVYLDGEEIYRFGQNPKLPASPGSQWHFIEFDGDESNVGKELVIVIKAYYAKNLDPNITVYCGSSGAVLLGNVKSELGDLICNAVLLIYGVILILIFWIERASHVGDRADYLLGGLCILTCLWSTCELFSFQMIFPSGVGQYYLYYLSFYAMPLFLILYVEHMGSARVTPVIYSHLLMVIVLLILQLTGIASFVMTMPVFLGLSLVEMVGGIVHIIRTGRMPVGKSIHRAMLFLIACVIVNSAFYFVDSARHPSLLLAKIGLIVYVSVNTYLSFAHLVVGMVKIAESEKVRELAFLDTLTQIGNRYAFMQDINTTNYQYIGLVSIDLNNLKYYNDTMGHIKGDQLIKDSADILKQVFEGSLYRTGGDEFISITAGKSTQELSALREEMHRKLEVYNRDSTHDMVLEIACGFSVYQNGDMSYEDILARADQEMYADKAAIKKVSKIKSVR